ncbi:hypothetical protein GOP47_0024793 [Adiantum capillus-veneris]|uniref:Uncharacterized protein n=1 Tax=Adiantum capillus-veneris TaxID=13818 RepID=A0A9D4U2S3_ADICA|nr:hypothetical protein GOP47_0024793 [Adiantum capillus-veneris]
MARANQRANQADDRVGLLMIWQADDSVGSMQGSFGSLHEQVSIKFTHVQLLHEKVSTWAVCKLVHGKFPLGQHLHDHS